MNTTPDMLSTAFKMLAALLLVLGGLGVFFYFAKRFVRKDGGGSADKIIRVLASQYIGLKKNISLVEVPGAVLVIGISADTIRLLTEIKDPITLDQIRERGSGRSNPTFAGHLNKLTSRFLAPKDD